VAGAADIVACWQQTLEMLARQFWALHERDNVLAGYAGPDDPRLVAFIKELWMRRNYGGKFGPTVHDLARDPETYGLGWNSNVFATGGVTRAEQFWLAFLATLPPEWAPAVETFLDACQYIGSHAHLKCGLVLTAPLDGARVQWNPIARAALMVPIGNHHLELRACGVLATTGKRERFVPTWWRRAVEPCRPLSHPHAGRLLQRAGPGISRRSRGHRDHRCA
jgi:hypothetical protein